MPLPFLIIVTGLPCTGKTTIARVIAADLSLPLLAKDDIKERLFDSLGWSDREWSKKLSRATFGLMFYFIELELSAGHSLIAEAPFYAHHHTEIFARLRERVPYRPLVIECEASGNILLERFVRRSESGERHPGHADLANYKEAETIFLGEKLEPLDLGGIRIVLDTNDFSQVDLDRLVGSIKAEMERTGP